MKGDVSKHITEQGVEGYQRLIESYKDHIRFMELQFHDYDKFPEVIFEDMTLREIVPKDVAKLIDVEKSGVLFWAEKIGKFSGFPEYETVTVTQQYYVRKVSLDHFFVASQHPEHARRRDFVMINHVYVPNGKTGFELPLDDAHQQEVKQRIFKDTFTRFWSNVIDKFIELSVNHADVIFLHLLLLWSPQNEGKVSASTMNQIEERRDWAKRTVKEYYDAHDVHNPDERIAKLVLLADEIDGISARHIEDVHIASLFEICDLKCSDSDFESGRVSRNENIVLISYSPLLS